MSKSVASEPKKYHVNAKMGGKRGAEDEEDENNDEIIEPAALPNSTTSTQSPTAPAAVDEFMFTNDFRRLLVEFVPSDTLMTLKLTTKAWKAVAEKVIVDGVKSGEIIVHGGKDIEYGQACDQKEKQELVTRVIFLQNLPRIGECACVFAVNLVVVDIPEGIVSIGKHAFQKCRSLTTVSFPTTLRSIGESAFWQCWILKNVDLRHTNLQEIGTFAFYHFLKLTSMTIPDSLQKLGERVFHWCSRLVPSHINVEDNDVVVAHLRFQQLRDEEKLEMAILTVDGKDVSQSEVDSVVKSVRMWHVTQAIVLLNITKVGDYACTFAANLVAVDIPEGVERIGDNAFCHCYILTTVSFPTTLTCIAGFAFGNCSSLDNVDLLHTNLQELGREAFAICSELTSMTIPDSLQKLGPHIFHKCSKLFPSNIIVNDATNDTTPEVITHLRSTKLQNSAPPG